MKEIIKYFNFKYLSILLGFICLILIYLLSVKEIEYVVEEVVKIESEKDELIYVDIKGAISNPGMYEMVNGARVSDVIEVSGGLLETANISYINLSKVLTDEDVIIIYTEEEIKKLTTGDTSVKVIETECICPEINNSACIEDNNNSNSTLININTASLEQLMTLSGIGESKALAIIEYRKNTKFNNIEELMNVSGIGSSTFLKIKDDITV